MKLIGQWKNQLFSYLPLFSLYRFSLSMVSSNKASSQASGDRSSKELDIPKANSVQGISESSSLNLDQDMTSLKSVSSPNVSRCKFVLSLVSKQNLRFTQPFKVHSTVVQLIHYCTKMFNYYLIIFQFG